MYQNRFFHVFFSFPSKEDDEKDRLIQVKELQQEEGDNTEPLEDSFQGLSVEEVRASRNSRAIIASWFCVT